MNNTCVTNIGCSGRRVPNCVWHNDRPTSMAASMLEYGVYLGDIIPHRATWFDLPKKGTWP